jgi:xylose isomerase
VYNPDQTGQATREHFKFQLPTGIHSVGKDQISGPGTITFHGINLQNAILAAKDKQDAALNFTTKMGFGYYCFHDYDLIQEGATLLNQSESRLATITDYLKVKFYWSKITWGTHLSNLVT